ncbi:MAG: class I SAM-dependent methyltransferase [Nanoarchaeota archaeon]|nr:class I SAM-dependent methyltransferase [Nanoarchaeota archaeon]
MNEKQIENNVDEYKVKLSGIRHFRDSKFFPRVLSFLKEKKNKRILEIGPGDGSGYEALKEVDADIVKNYEAVDLANMLLDKVKKDIKLYEKNLSEEKIPVKDNTYDIVMAFEVIEHVRNPWSFIEETKRVMKKGGYLLISFPTGKSIFSKIKFLFTGNVCNFYKDNGHITFFPKAVQENIFRDFKLIEEFSPRFNVPYFPYIKMPGRPAFADKRLYIYRLKNK